MEMEDVAGVEDPNEDPEEDDLYWNVQLGSNSLTAE